MLSRNDPVRVVELACGRSSAQVVVTEGTALHLTLVAGCGDGTEPEAPVARGHFQPAARTATHTAPWARRDSSAGQPAIGPRIRRRSPGTAAYRREPQVTARAEPAGRPSEASSRRRF